MTMTKRGNLGAILFGLAATAAAGYVLGLLTPEEKKREYADKVGRLREELKPENLEKRLSDVYDSVNQQARDRYEEARDLFMEKLASIRGSLDEIDKNKYEQALDDFVEDMKTQGDLTKDQIAKLRDYFRHDYRVIKKSLFTGHKARE